MELKSAFCGGGSETLNVIENLLNALNIVLKFSILVIENQ